MKTTPAQIDLWRGASREHQQLEFKEAKNQFDSTRLHRYCVALANEGGGILLMGIADKPPRPVVGTQAHPDPVASAEKLFEALGFRVDVEAVAHPDGRVVVFHIPPRPKGTAYQLGGAYWMRSGEELVPMSEDQLRKIFAEGAPDAMEEFARTGLHGAAVVDLLDTQRFFELIGLPYPSDRNGVLDRLLAERLIDETPGGFGIRRLTALLLAKRLSDFPEVERKAVRVVVYNGTSKLETKLDRKSKVGYAASFTGMVRFIMSQLPQNEVIENALRKEVKLIPEIAVREVLANALIHQDLNMEGASVMVEIYGDRVEFSNPGEPIVPTERFIDGYQSRNERMADLMRRMHICEERSSGIDKLVNAAEVFQLPAPEFRVGHRRTQVIIYGPKPFADMDRADRIRACYQHCVLRYVMNERMTNQSLRERFHLPESKVASITQIIAATLESGAIKPDERVGSSRKFARYLPHWA
jgi:predicted HTH transcriptional regulator